MPPPSLVPPAWRRRVGWAIAVGALVAAVLGVVTFHRTTTAFDSWAFRILPRHIGPTGATFTLHCSDPWVDCALLALVAALGARLRRPALTALAIAGPAAAVAMTELVLKPLVARPISPAVTGSTLGGLVSTSYPSGHETGVASTAVVLLVAAWQLQAPRRRRVPVLLGSTVVLSSWCVAAGVGLVRNYWHYATDVVGAVGVSVAVVLGVALACDRGFGRLSSPAARSRTSTSRAA